MQLECLWRIRTSSAPQIVLLQSCFTFEKIFKVLPPLHYLLDLLLAEVLLLHEVFQLRHHLLHHVTYGVRHGYVLALARSVSAASREVLCFSFQMLPQRPHGVFARTQVLALS
eukprot:GHUV01056545.1.p1 GENE.GHUV01056545.1~~GHUV01056545.1.p1  ORF type:complete len:113 (+),score=4.50 GHUV01056545.1:9-347(+)